MRAVGRLSLRFFQAIDKSSCSQLHRQSEYSYRKARNYESLNLWNGSHCLVRNYHRPTHATMTEILHISDFHWNPQSL
ncbi:hypothetical protein CO2235_MP20115 [Cupriavidus oxalaticus]|uniref:Uncharacterized protein n=1 Tax=Cupriavidus oxalaticus TaxID=96344 RepID=A0A976GCU2_9BURK|nr:hypothetical protein CO2235_MP20115 [Cupriavidus oxalaticus]